MPYELTTKADVQAVRAALATDFGTHISGRWYQPLGTAMVGIASPTSANILRMYPGIIKEQVTIDQLGIRVTTAGAAGSGMSAIYKSLDTKPTGLPVAKTGVYSIATAAAMAVPLDPATSVTLDPGIYFFASVCDVQASFIVPLQGPASLYYTGGPAVLDSLSGQPPQGYGVSLTFGQPFPDLTGSNLAFTTGNSVTPAIGYRAA